jgi:hypothetical protein
MEIHLMTEACHGASGVKSHYILSILSRDAALSNPELQGEVVPKFLIDECLSPDLTVLARDCGFGESSHVAWLAKAGWKDWELKRSILEQDWTFVTRSSVDFGGPANQPGSGGSTRIFPSCRIGLHQRPGLNVRRKRSRTLWHCGRRTRTQSDGQSDH